jgi:CRP-like cAMP-binding protein
MRKVLHILGDFNDQDIEWLIDSGIKKTVQSDEYLIEANVQLYEIYFVLGGRFDIDLPDGTSIAKIKSGEILGEMSFIEEEPPMVNVKATEEAMVISISHETLMDRFKESIGFEGRFYKAMSLFLSSRLRGVATKISYENTEIKTKKEFAQDIDNATLNRIQIAGERFNRLLSHFS